jgi:hypothetical protein
VSAELDDPLALPEIPPSPEGGLELTVRCRTVRTGPGGRSHPVTINPDWSVTTPHDLELERIAVAMGGYLSCLQLVDSEVPALRKLTQLRARRTLPEILRNSSARWTLHTLAVGCDCVPYGFASAAEAADHARSPLHVARQMHAVPRGLERLLYRVEHAHGTAFCRRPADEWGAGEVVRERDGLDQLWDCGIHPRLVARLHEALWRDGPPMPAWFYLGAATCKPDLSWVAATLQAVPDEDVAVWLCWTNTELDRRHPDARTVWLRAGVPRHAIATLAAGNYTPVDVARLAASTRRNIPRAALTLAAWHKAGCHPTPEQIALLDELDVDPWYEPSTGAVDWLWDRVRMRKDAPTRTEIGLLLAVCGTRPATLKMLDNDVRDPRVAARLMDGETHTMLPAPQRARA